MSDPTPEKRPRGNPAMRAGAPSLNPNGRPRVGESIAEATRSKLPPELYVEKLLKLADTATSEQVRLGALLALGERAYGKVTTTIDASINAGSSSTDYEHLAAMPLEKRRALLAELRGEPVRDADGHRMATPDHDDEKREQPSLVAPTPDA